MGFLFRGHFFTTAGRHMPGNEHTRVTEATYTTHDIRWDMALPHPTREQRKIAIKHILGLSGIIAILSLGFLVGYSSIGDPDCQHGQYETYNSSYTHTCYTAQYPQDTPGTITYGLIIVLISGMVVAAGSAVLWLIGLLLWALFYPTRET